MLFNSCLTLSEVIYGMSQLRKEGKWFGGDDLHQCHQSSQLATLRRLVRLTREAYPHTQRKSPIFLYGGVGTFGLCVPINIKSSDGCTRVTRFCAFSQVKIPAARSRATFRSETHPPMDLMP